MDLRCQLALDKSRDKLVDDLDIKRAADYLVSNSVLTWEDNERILLPNQTSFDQRRSLLGMLPQRGQKAFDTFCEFLRNNQAWLHDIVVEHLESITKEEVSNYKRRSPCGDAVSTPCTQILQGLSRQELQAALTHKLYIFVQNDPSNILKHAEEGIYIEQSLRIETQTDSEQDKQPQQGEPSTSSVLLLSNATPGERIIVYGGPGMGKSTFCRKLTKTWADGNPEIRKRFDYIFPIPLRSLHSHSLSDIICRDVGLIPESCKTRLHQELDMNSTRILFILDSFEEQFDKADDNVINKLLRRELFPESTVLVTSRPNARMQQLQSETNPCTAVHLQGLTASQTEAYIQSYPNLQEDVFSKVKENFGTSFLQCPLNLWLICNLLAGKASKASAGEIEIPETQTVLLNRFIQQIMLSYVKKKKLPEFTASAQSPMKIEDAPEARSILSALGRLCYTAIKDKSHVLEIGQEVLSIKDVMEVGLFTEGPEENSVVLPHPVFQEYLAALHLSSDKLARQNVIKDIASQLECSIGKCSLEDALNTRGLKETIRFLIGLLPAMAKDLCNLFVIKQRDVPGVESTRSALQPDMQYELGLLGECADKDVKHNIAMALLNAPVIPDSQPSTDYVLNTGSYELLRYFTEEQCLLFMKKAYNVDPQPDKLSLFVKTSDKEPVLDNFAVGFLHLYDYSVQIPSLSIVHSHLPVRMLRENMAAVRRMHLSTCVLCEQLEQYISLFNIAVKRMHKFRTERNTAPLKLLSLDSVISLNSLSSLRPTQALVIESQHKETYELAKMMQLFGEVKKLKLVKAEFVYPAKTHWSSVAHLTISKVLGVNIGELSEVFPNVENMVFEHVVVQLRASVTKWQSVRFLEMSHSSLDTTDAGRLNKLKASDELKHMCPQAQPDLTKYQERPEAGTEVVALFNYKGGVRADLSFQKGDHLRIIKRTRDPMWSLAQNRLGAEGMIPSNYVTTKKEVPLEPMPWYHGELTRDDCRKMLSSCKVGTYLIKNNIKYPKDYTLCVRYPGGVEFYRIIVKDNKMTIDEEQWFSCLPRLVEDYKRDAYGLCTKLEQCVAEQGQPRVTVDEAAFSENHWAIEAENIELHECISSLEYGGVFSGTHFGQSVMVKRPNQTRQRETTLLEAAVMTALQHPNVATFMGVILGNTIQLVTEYLSQGPLLQYIRTKATEVTKEQQLKFARDVCHGMLHLEEKGFLHRYLKANHVWVHEDGTAKLLNLWQARPVDSNQLKPTPIVAVQWAAPEVIQCGKFSTKSDMWSFGVVLWEIYTLGKEPYASLEKGNKQVMLQHLEEGHRLQIPADCPQSVADIMKEAWAADPDDRPTFSAVLKRLATD